MATSTPIYELHSEDTEWLSKLSFYKDEIAIMQKQIEEIASKNSSNDVLVPVEHFQNQFLIQRKQIDILKHKIKAHEASLPHAAEQTQVAVDNRKIEDHTTVRDNMLQFEELFSQLRTELRVFVAKWM